MNLDVRNIDADFENAVEHIKDSVPGATTNVKAVRHATINYETNLDIIIKLEDKIQTLENKIIQYDLDKQETRSYFKLQKKLSKKFT